MTDDGSVPDGLKLVIEPEVAVPTETLRHAVARYQLAVEEGEDVDPETVLCEYVEVRPRWRTGDGGELRPK